MVRAGTLWSALNAGIATMKIDRPDRKPDFEDDDHRIWKMPKPDKFEPPKDIMVIDIEKEAVHEQRNYRMVGATIVIFAKRDLSTDEITFSMKMRGPKDEVRHTPPVKLAGLIEYGLMISEFEATMGALILDKERIDGSVLHRRMKGLGAD